MNFEIENERRGAEYRSALGRIDESLAFWNAIGSGQPVFIATSEVLLESWPPPTPDQAYREAIDILDGWRGFRAAQGRP